MALRHPRRGTPSMTVASLLFPVSTADDEHGGTSLVARCGGAPPHGPVGKATTRARRRATPRALVPSGQRTWGAEEEVGNWVAPPGAAGSPVMEDSRSRFASAPPSPGPSSSPAPQIRAHARHVRTSSLQRFRHQMQRVEVGARRRWRRRREEPREQLLRTTVNIEAMANQKRQWYHIHAKDQNQFKEPSSLFEHFFVVGLHSYANVAVIEDAFAKKKDWESNVACSEVVDLSKIQYH